MIPPLISYVTWNRLGLTIRNLSALLAAPDDFELHLVDSNSQDGTWEYLESLRDARIKEIVRFDRNRGSVYAGNYNLSKRRQGQYFFTVDSDVLLLTPDWLPRFMKAFEVFPELGLLGAVRSEFYVRHRLTAIRRQWQDLYYDQLPQGFVEGCCQCIRPEVLERLGYWCEENCFGDTEMCYRVLHHTPYKIGYFPCVVVDQAQTVPCKGCPVQENCSCLPLHTTCFEVYRNKYRNSQFRNHFEWKYRQFLKDLESGKRTAYCPSVHCPESMKKGAYHQQMAEENFRYYMENAN